MKKTILTVFLIIAVLVIALLVWALFFNQNGVLQRTWNGVASQVNSVWNRITGLEGIVPEWKVTNNLSNADNDFETAAGGAAGAGSTGGGGAGGGGG